LRLDTKWGLFVRKVSRKRNTHTQRMRERERGDVYIMGEIKNKKESERRYIK
jgi:hypothetical protein